MDDEFTKLLKYKLLIGKKIKGKIKKFIRGCYYVLLDGVSEYEAAGRYERKPEKSFSFMEIEPDLMKDKITEFVVLSAGLEKVCGIEFVILEVEPSVLCVPFVCTVANDVRVSNE